MHCRSMNPVKNTWTGGHRWHLLAQARLPSSRVPYCSEWTRCSLRPAARGGAAGVGNGARRGCFSVHYCKVLHCATWDGLRAGAVDAARDIATAVRPGIPVGLCGDRPRDGSFGLLPLVEHDAARQVSLAVQLGRFLAVAGELAPTVLALSSVLRHICPDLPTGADTVACTHTTPHRARLAAAELPPRLAQRRDRGASADVDTQHAGG
eukprot:361114-Chlamydomonas_euryale.AAC.6